MSSSLNDIDRPKCASHCLVCKSVSTETILYVCESGHIVCGSCQNNVADGNTKQKHRKHSQRHSKKEVKRSIPGRNLACGDHEELTKDQNTVSRQVVFENNGDLRTTVEYKNINYSESNSSTNSTFLKHVTDRNILSSNSNKICPRPIKCPHCLKMISTSSVCQHFQFDHSKIPTAYLLFNSPQAIKFKDSDVFTESRCVAIFLLKGPHSHSTTCVEHIPVLLMTARFDTNQNAILTTKYTNNRHSKYMYNSCTQSNIIDSKHKLGSNEGVSKTEININTSTESSYQTNEVLLMWIIKTEVNDLIYNITISSEDQTLGFSYRGKAVDISDHQDASAIYNRSECLTIHGKAIDRLMSEGCFLVTITLVATIKNKNT